MLALVLFLIPVSAVQADGSGYGARSDGGTSEAQAASSTDGGLDSTSMINRARDNARRGDVNNSKGRSTGSNVVYSSSSNNPSKSSNNYSRSSPNNYYRSSHNSPPPGSTITFVPGTTTKYQTAAAHGGSHDCPPEAPWDPKIQSCASPRSERSYTPGQTVPAGYTYVCYDPDDCILVTTESFNSGNKAAADNTIQNCATGACDLRYSDCEPQVQFRDCLEQGNTEDICRLQLGLPG